MKNVSDFGQTRSIMCTNMLEVYQNFEGFSKYTEEVIDLIFHWWSNQQLTFCLCGLRAAILDHQFYISILPP